VQAAAGEDQLAARAPEDHVDGVDRGIGGGVGEHLEVALERGVQRAVEPGRQVVARLAAQPAGPAVDDDEHRLADDDPVALGAPDGGRRALVRPAGSALGGHPGSHRRRERRG
jgi:hypothetical protein